MRDFEVFTAVKIQIEVFWVVELWNVIILLQNYTASHPRRLASIP